MIILGFVRHYLGLMLVLVIAFPSSSHAQTVLNFKNGQIVEEYIPFGKKFSIKGSTKIANSDADIIKLRITTDGDTIDEDLPYERFWYRSDDSEDEFTFSVPRLLGYGNSYSFNFTFFKKADIDKEIIKKIIEVAFSEVEREFVANGNSITLTQIDNILNANVNQQIKDIFGVGRLRNIDNDIISEGLKVINISRSQADLIRRIATVAAEKSVIRAQESVIKTSRDKINSIIEDDFKSLVDTVDSLNLVDDKLSLLREAYKSPDKVNTDTLAVTMGPVIPKLMGFTDDSFFKNIVLLIEEPTKIQLASARIKIADSVIESNSKNLSELQNLLFDELSTIYIETSNLEFKDYVWETETRIEELNISTVYGVTPLALQCCKSETELEVVSYVAFKIHFGGPVDKSLPGEYAYKNGSKWAFTFGSVFNSEIKYKGQTQEDIFANIKPMVGLSYDFTRFVGLNFGLTGFKQPSINPLASDLKRIKLAPFIGITFDFNPINRLNDLINPKS